MTDNKRDIRKWILGIFFLTFFVLIFILNRMYPVHSDDWMYSFVFYEKPVRFVSSIGDIFVSQYNHYLYWGGRNVVHFIDQLLLLFSPLVREIINSLAFLGFIYIIYKIANARKEVSPYLFLFIAIVLWIGLPTFPQTVVWITGSANYLWGTLIALAFIYPYYNYYQTESLKNSVARNILFFIAGIFSGWTNENLSVALLFILFVFLLYFKIRHIRLPQWAVWGFIGALSGCAIMLAAPGNFIRAEGTNAAFNLDEKPFVDVLWFKARNIYLIYKYIPTVIGLIGAYVISVLIYWFGNKHTRNPKVVSGSVLFFMAAHVSAIAMIASPIFPVRASFCMHAFMIVSIAILYGDFVLDSRWKKMVNIAMLAILCIWFVKVYESIYTPTHYLNQRYKVREEYIEEQKRKGVNDVVLTEPEIILPGQFDFEDITADDTSWRNTICADYYKLNSIKRISK
ncbi:DUF3329 domain-containing protein [Dysgonomonas macrotermitis]|uniref:Glucosyl transferase GtrII n=1 Tax=Dysgonomonas macrotermitis TaxID=1346286 RepID=A0A1M4UFL5_9BACT|nr:DUF6056 family protein [Dysgonomonas macrotermitis]SHE55393.1 hypothetical protein SAMN05444362_101585 [Dysgonomonas macrotermitis]